MPEDPVPMTATRLPCTSTPPWGHCPVWCTSPEKVSSPSIAGRLAEESAPTAMMRNSAVNRSP